MRFPSIRSDWGSHTACVGLGALIVAAIWVGVRVTEEVKLRRAICRAWAIEGSSNDPHVVASQCEFRPDGTFHLEGTTKEKEQLCQSGQWRVSGNVLLLDYDKSPYGGPRQAGQKPQRFTIVRADGGMLVLVEASGYKIKGMPQTVEVP